MSRTVASEAAGRLRAAILAGDLPAGVTLRETDLAARFAFSRGAVRQGLVILEGEGLVVNEWHRGTQVRALAPKDVDELYTLREALDVLAMRIAAGKPTDRLDEVVDEMRHATTDVELVALDVKFHDAVYEAAGHRRLTEAWRAIRSQVQLFLLARVTADATYRDIVASEHAELAKILRAGDPDVAGRAAEEHLRGSYATLVEGRECLPK